MNTDSQALQHDTPCAKSPMFKSRFTSFSATKRSSFFDKLPTDTAVTISSPSNSNTNPCGRLAHPRSQRLTKSEITCAVDTSKRPGISDILMADMSSAIPSNSVSNTRLFYRQWRTAPQGGSGDWGTSGTDFENKTENTPITGRSTYTTLSGVHDTEPSFVQASIAQDVVDAHLPRIMEKSELNCNEGGQSVMYNDMELREDLLSRELEKMDIINSEKDACVDEIEAMPRNDDSRHVHPVGSYEQQRTSAENAGINLIRASSYQALSDLEKENYFPTPPKPSARGVQRGLKDSVVNDMCRAVVKHMVGDIYVVSSGPFGLKKVLNHLYDPVLNSVQIHFRRLPARYALSVNPDDVPLHMRLLAKHRRNPSEVGVSVQQRKDDDGKTISNECEVVVVSADQDNLLDAITRALTSLKGSILDADVMTTCDGVTLDRFVVRGTFLSGERQMELKNRIEDNLFRLSLESDPETPSLQCQQDDKQKFTLNMIHHNEVKSDWQLNISEIKLGKSIGTGRSGHTFESYWRGTRVAVKVVDCSKHSEQMAQEILNEFQREITIASKLRHPNIVLFLGATICPPRYCLVFEYMANGTLSNLINSRKTLLDFFQIAKDIAMGMNYLHLCSVIHRDLKSGNILIDSHGLVKISDFGLSCFIDNNSTSDLTAETGTYRWMAPEVIRHEAYSFKADVYSFGIVLWEMIAKDQPFRGMTPIQAAFAVARQHARPALPKHIPAKLAEFVEYCWHQEPQRRPAFSDIIEAIPLIKSSLKKRDFRHLSFLGS